jgi:hypothetical protein
MEKTIQITLSELQALLKEQKELCARAYLENFKNHGILNAPLPDLSNLKEVKNDVTNDKGMKWVKASERLPKKIKGQIFRQMHSKTILSELMAKDWIEDGCVNDLEWLDESAEGQQLTELQKENKALWNALKLIKGIYPKEIDRLLGGMQELVNERK